MVIARPSRILLVHGESAASEALARALRDAQHVCTECGAGAEAYIRLRREPFDVVVSDIENPGVNGLELLDLAGALRNRPEVILMSADTDTERVRRAFKRGAFDVIPKPFTHDELRSVVAAALELRRSETSGRNDASPQQTKRGYIEATLSLVAAVEAKEPHMRAHAQTVSRYCETLARRMELPEPRIETLKTAALLHDIGKIGVPDAVLRKPGPLTTEEFAIIKKHPETALRILRHNSFLDEELSYILHHHERYDGGGYPAGLAGENIPFGARLLCVCDSLDAMLSARSYKRGMDIDEAKSELRSCSGKQFDPRAAQAAIEWLDADPGAVTRE